MFQKVIKVREQVAADLGLNMPARSYEEHLDDFLTMILRMAVTLSVAFVAAFYWSKTLIQMLMHLLEPILVFQGPVLDRIWFLPKDEANFWVMIGIMIAAPMLLCYRTGLRSGRAGATTINFK